MSLAELNAQQRVAVTAPDGPALVLAGAGSGKTRVIVERIAWLAQERGVDPRNILALTFTNKAAGEMKSRITTRLAVEKLAAWVGTFHSFGLFILRREIDRLGRQKTFTIFDDTDQISLIKRLAKDLPVRFARVSPREALSWISRRKQDLETPTADDEEVLRELWDRYHNALSKYSAVDFDDLLVLTARLFEEHEDMRDKYRGRYRHVLVDEYQDTNRVQYRLARALAGDGGNIFAVGDEDQAIYSWRGANIRNILDFESDFPNANVIHLEQNYRSTAPILSAANAVVSENVDRLGKTLFTEQSGGEKVSYYLATDAEDEARFVVETIAKRGFEPRNVAVLIRTNGQARLFEDAFRRKGIAYTIIGGTKFYARKEIKDLLAYLRLLINPLDDESLLRVINTPPRGMGAATIERLESLAYSRGLPMLRALQERDWEDVAGARAKAAMELAHFLEDLARSSAEAPVGETLEKIIDTIGYRAYVQESDDKDFRTRLEIVDEFISSCHEFDAKDGGGLEAFLQDLALVSDIDNYEADRPAVTLMTCHSAKGLEFAHVFLAGLEEGLLPHGTAQEDAAEIEEERRLCYVAMTRARETLHLSGAESRVWYGERQQREPSRFLEAIPQGDLHVVPRELGGRGAEMPAPRRVETDRVKTGARVRHARFGAGTVMYTSGAGVKLKVRIRFDGGMARDFLVSAAPLEILEGKRA